jgi:hypothetical protein
MTMQHSDAEDTMAVERYLLGEMSATEREEFEEHVFSCHQCADDVRYGTAFCENARAVFKDDPRFGKESWLERFGRRLSRVSLRVLAPALASVALLCVAGYQRLVVIPGLEQQVVRARAPQAIAAFALPGLSRGEEPVIKAPAEARFAFYFDVATPSPSGYSCEFREASGAVRLTVAVPPAAGGTVYLALDRSQLPAGEYTLVVTTQGPDTKEAGQYPFRIEY